MSDQQQETSPQEENLSVPEQIPVEILRPEFSGGEPDSLPGMEISPLMRSLQNISRINRSIG